jgi:predicted ArsR family transcriptional regulator
MSLLGGAGYEPAADPAAGTVRLRNCPYHALAASHRDLTCGMNLAWAEGMLDGLGDPRLTAELAPAPGFCCVVFDRAAGESAPEPTSADRADGTPKADR